MVSTEEGRAGARTPAPQSRGLWTVAQPSTLKDLLTRRMEATAWPALRIIKSWRKRTCHAPEG